MFGGLPGGSPGPNATATWRGLLFVLLVTAVVLGGLTWMFLFAIRFAESSR